MVDDEPLVTEVVERYLHLQDFEVSLAAAGHQALQTAHDWHPDLVVRDLMLPGMDGLEVCRNIRKESAIPIIMLTRRDRPDSGSVPGANDYMVKSLAPENW